MTAIGCGEEFAQGRKTVNGLLHESPLAYSAAATMFYLTVVFEKGDVVDCGFDAEDEREFVVHLDGHGPIACLMRVPSMRMLKRLLITS